MTWQLGSVIVLTGSRAFVEGRLDRLHQSPVRIYGLLLDQIDKRTVLRIDSADAKARDVVVRPVSAATAAGSSTSASCSSADGGSTTTSCASGSSD